MLVIKAIIRKVGGPQSSVRLSKVPGKYNIAMTTCIMFILNKYRYKQTHFVIFEKPINLYSIYTTNSQFLFPPYQAISWQLGLLFRAMSFYYSIY